MNKNKINQAVQTVVKPQVPPVSILYVGPDYTTGILLSGEMLRPRDWSNDQIANFFTKEPARADAWFKKKEDDAQTANSDILDTHNESNSNAE